MGIASLILGIVSIVFSFIPFMGLIGGIIGIVGIILGALGRKTLDQSKRGMATGGLVCSIIGTVLCLIFYVACVACVTGTTHLIR